MNIITADTNWISLIIFLIAGITSIIKYLSKRSQTIESEHSLSQEGEEEEVIFLEPQIITHPQDKKELVELVGLATTKEKEQNAEKPKEKNIQSQLQREQSSPKDQPASTFDLRQAVIGNVILNRPEF